MRRHALNAQAAIPNHNQMRRLQRRPHFFEHLGEPINGVRRPAFGPPQVSDGVKCPIRIGMAINNQQPVHWADWIGITIVFSEPVGAIFSAGCVGTVLCANGSSSSVCTRDPAGSTMVAVTKIIRLFLVVTLLWLWNKRPNEGMS